jgi:hypothetical protein
LRQAVTTTPKSIIYIDKSYHEDLVKCNGWCIEMIEQTEKMCELAVKQDPYAICCIHRPSDAILSLVWRDLSKAVRACLHMRLKKLHYPQELLQKYPRPEGVEL